MDNTSPVRVFISYSHDSDEHKQWVLDLATRLRSMGVDATIDQWDLPPGADSARFMQDSVTHSDRVIMVCSDQYVTKADERLGGVGFENMIITGEMVAKVSTSKFIPVIRMNPKTSIPKFLGARIYINFNDDAAFDDKLEDLARELHGVPRLTKPPIGNSPFVSNSQPIAESSSSTTIDVFADPWFDDMRAMALPRAEKYGRGNMEVAFGPRSKATPVSHQELLRIARTSAIHTFGWPIGVVFDDDDGSPHPTKWGITAEIVSAVTHRENYDFWALTRTGSFISVLNIFEEERDPDAIFFNTRISRVTEALQYARNVIDRLGNSGTTVDFRIRHTGLQGRVLSSSNPNRRLGSRRRICHEDEAQAVVSYVHPLTDDQIISAVKDVLAPMFSLFDYFELSDSVYEDIVTKYLKGDSN